MPAPLGPFADDQVRPIGVVEQKMYEELSAVSGRTAENLKQRFSLPSYSVAHISAGDKRGSSSTSSLMSGSSAHKLRTDGLFCVSRLSGATVIPSTVRAAVSFRLVPDQDLEQITRSITEYLDKTFCALNSPNQLKIEVPHRADWWLGDIKCISLQTTLLL